MVFEGVGRSSGKMRNDISEEWPMMNERFDLATDEGPFHGGDGTAPPPLALRAKVPNARLVLNRSKAKVHLVSRK